LSTIETALERKVVAIAEVGLKIWAVSIVEHTAIQRVIPVLRRETLGILKAVSSLKNSPKLQVPGLIALDLVVSCLEPLLLVAASPATHELIDDYLVAIRKTLQMRVNVSDSYFKDPATVVAVLRDQIATTDLVLRISEIEIVSG
jgi:hypothetical protein